MKLVCPNNPKHKRFTVATHEVHHWIVDETVGFIRDLGCTEVTHVPAQGDLFTCTKCSAEAKVSG